MANFLFIEQSKFTELISPKLARAKKSQKLARCLWLVHIIKSKQNYNPKKVVVYYLYLLKIQNEYKI